MLSRAKRENALLGARFLLVTSSTTKGRVKLIHVQRLLEGLGLHDVGVGVGAVGDWVDVVCQPIGIRVDQELQAETLRCLVPKFDHVPEFPGCIHVEEWKRRRGWIKG